MTQSLPRPSKPNFNLSCSFRLERESGFSVIAGIDEVGRGCLAGPVVVAGVVFSQSLWLSDEEWLQDIDDSKKLKAEKRNCLDEKIRKAADAVEIGFCSESEIDDINILQATFKAARDVVSKLEKKISNSLELILMDGSQRIPRLERRQHPVIGGDRISKSIAAASIVAKVYRDRWMERLSSEYEGYGFEKHKGYGTKDHLKALRLRGPSRLHRKSFLKKFHAMEQGQEAEARAAEFLSAQGFKILERNWKASGAEVDIVASKSGELHLFEVRYRSQAVELPLVFPLPKQNQFKKSLDLYLLEKPEYAKTPCHLHFLSLSSGDKIEAFWDVFKF